MTHALHDGVGDCLCGYSSFYTPWLQHEQYSHRQFGKDHAKATDKHVGTHLPSGCCSANVGPLIPPVADKRRVRKVDHLPGNEADLT